MNSSLRVSKHLAENIAYLKNCLPIGTSYDLIARTLVIANRNAYFVCINGLCEMNLINDILADLQNPSFLEAFDFETAKSLIEQKIGYAQTSVSDSFDEIILQLLSGPCAIFVEGYDEAIVLDVRSYPKRGMDEPEMEQMTRGARDGFVETLSSNTCLVRRRVRSPHLVFEKLQIGTVSQTDVAICYLGDLVNTSLLEKLRESLEKIKASTLTMGAMSLLELLVPKRCLSIMPCMQLTQRPDVACSYLTEGHILLLVDNSPMALILPCTIFQFTQSPEDYLKNPLAGTYFRLLRFLCMPINLLLMPVFLLLTTCYPDFRDKWNLISTGQMQTPRIIFYVIAVELFLDLFRFASTLNAGKQSGPLSIVGGLIIGDMAVTLNWASPEFLFYGGITLLAGLTLSSPELADALRIYRIFMVLSTSFLGKAGFYGSLCLVLLSIIRTPTFGGMSYFWPLFPFHGKALCRLLFRSPTYKAQPSRNYKRGRVS